MNSKPPCYNGRIRFCQIKEVGVVKHLMWNIQWWKVGVFEERGKILKIRLRIERNYVFYNKRFKKMFSNVLNTVTYDFIVSVILPGSKPVTSSWASGSGVEPTPETDVRLNKHGREYEKPWLSGAKIGKGKVQRGDRLTNLITNVSSYRVPAVAESSLK